MTLDATEALVLGDDSPLIDQLRERNHELWKQIKQNNRKIRKIMLIEKAQEKHPQPSSGQGCRTARPFVRPQMQFSQGSCIKQGV